MRFLHLVQVWSKLKLDFDTFGQTIHNQTHTDRRIFTHDKYNTGKNIQPKTDGDRQDVGDGQTRSFTLLHLHNEVFSRNL